MPARSRAARFWIVPLAAAALCIAWGITSLGNRGPTITIVFATADGLAAGRSTLRLRNVEIGRVTRVRALRGQPGVTIDVRLNADAHALAVADTRFWIVRPRIGPVASGLDTVLSGTYIAAALGHSREPRTTFTGPTRRRSRKKAAATTRCARHRSARSRSARPSITGAHAWAR